MIVVNGNSRQWLLAIMVGFSLVGCNKLEPEKAGPPIASVTTAPPVDDAFWLNLNRRRVDIYRTQLKAAPPVLVVRASHYAFNPTNGMGMHYGWLDCRLANLHISFSELVGYAYGRDGSFDGRQYARTEFPDEWTRGRLTNKFDVIVTITNQPKESMQAEARKLLRRQFGLAWHREPKATDVLFIRAKDPALLQSKASTDFPHSKALSELAGELENYFRRPVVDETGAIGRYDKRVELVPARWVNGRTTDLDENNKFLAAFGLELVPGKLSQEWLVMERVK